MFYSSDFNRIFHDTFRNSSYSCADIGLHGWIIVMLCHLCGIFKKCGSCVSFESVKLCVYFVDYLDIMGTDIWMEVIFVDILRLVRKKVWPTDYEKVMHTVKRKPIANHLFQDSFMGGS